jgi:hypothetical protein
MKYVACAVLLGAGSAQALEVFRADEVKPSPASQASPAWPPGAARPAPASPGISALLGLWQTNIPGAVYTAPSSRPGYDELHVGSGAAAGLLRLNADRTYSWNSYGGKTGRWEASGDAAYPLTLVDSVENKRWKVGLDPRTGELIVWGGSYWYNGRRASLR